jgi:hypothetical protein
MIRGFSNPDIRDKLKDSSHLKDIADPRRGSAKVTPIFNRCRAHGLIAKIPHSRRWRLTKQDRIAMTASIQLHDIQFPITHMKLCMMQKFSAKSGECTQEESTFSSNAVCLVQNQLGLKLQDTKSSLELS